MRLDISPPTAWAAATASSTPRAPSTGAVEQRIAGEDQLRAVGGAAEQLAAPRWLERADLAAQGGLGDVQPFGRAPEVQLLGDRDECAQVAELDRLGRGGERQGHGSIMPSVHDRHAGSAFPFRAAVAHDPGMRKLVESTFITLDGVIGDPQVWGPPYWDAQHSAYAAKLLFRRRSAPRACDVRGLRPGLAQRSGDPFTDKLNSMPKYVASRTLLRHDMEREGSSTVRRGYGCR